MKRLSLDKVVSILGSREVLGVDTETQGLRWLDDKLLMLQIYDGEDNFLIDCQTVDISPLKDIFKSNEIIKIFHNSKFDVKFLKANGLDTENVYDTMLIEKVIHCGKKNFKVGLKFLMERYFNITLDKEVRNTFINHKGDFTKHQMSYGLDDTVKLLEIRDIQLKELQRLQIESVAKLENAAALAFADIEYNGLYLDKAAWSTVAVAIKEQIDTIYTELEDDLHREFPEYREKQIDMFGEGRLNTINWDSPKQVLELMQQFDPELTGVGAPALKAITHLDPLIAKYVEYKEKSKRYNAYGPDFYKYLHSDGRVHTSFDQILDTGRVSSRGPNMQQIPADNLYRNSFIPKNKDWVYVSSDFTAQELCIIAYGSQDPVWLKALRNGEDLHGNCAELIFGTDWTKLGPTNAARKETKEGHKLRTHVKTINFALAYGAGPFTIAKSLGITEDEAKALIKKYFKTFPKIEVFLNGLANYGEKNMSIRTFKPFRRIRHFEVEDNSKKEISRVRRASKNTPIQGSGADMTKLALVMLRNEIAKLPYGVKMVLTVHDEINCICEREHAEEFAQLLSSTMEKSATYIVGEGLLRCDATITDRWEK